MTTKERKETHFTTQGVEILLIKMDWKTKWFALYLNERGIRKQLLISLERCIKITWTRKQIVENFANPFCLSSLNGRVSYFKWWKRVESQLY